MLGTKEEYIRDYQTKRQYQERQQNDENEILFIAVPARCSSRNERTVQHHYTKASGQTN
jgi:hypothetical protein